MNASLLEVALEDLKDEKGYKLDTDLNAEDLKLLTQKFKEQVFSTTGRKFPNDVKEQLWGAIAAVFLSWNTHRAIAYRGLHGIPEASGHGRQRAVDGVRKYGRRLGNGCCVHEKSFDRRKQILRRMARECSRRRCRCRNSHSAWNHCCRSENSGTSRVFARRENADTL